MVLYLNKVYNLYSSDNDNWICISSFRALIQIPLSWQLLFLPCLFPWWQEKELDNYVFSFPTFVCFFYSSICSKYLESLSPIHCSEIFFYLLLTFISLSTSYPVSHQLSPLSLFSMVVKSMVSGDSFQLCS